MKYFILSDIHGSLPALDCALRQYDLLHCDMLCLLGDLLNYGPRNGLPEGLDAPAVAERLNEHAAHIMAVRGNCDSEVDQMLLRFPILSDYALLVDGGKRLLLTHGHLPAFAPQPDGTLPPLSAGIDVLFTGHTHLWQLQRNGTTVCCNTGSPTFPKDGNPPTFAVYENGLVTVHRLDGTLLARLTL